LDETQTILLLERSFIFPRASSGSFSEAWIWNQKSSETIFLRDRNNARSAMPSHQSKEQKETVGRVMHEFKHGELKTAGGRKVKSPKQAIAIGLHEAGASKYESKEKNRENLKRTKRRERGGATAKATGEGAPGREKTRSALYAEARRRNIPGRSKMDKNGLERALNSQ
jgi:hypothetical protein